MKVLLTGATGFLGKYVIDELKNNSYQVVAFGRNEKIGKTLIDENVEFFKGDIDNLDDLFKASQDCTALYMLLHFLLFGVNGKISIMQMY